MLDYEWANPSSVMLDESESVNGSDPNRHLHHHNSILDHYSSTQAAFNNLLPPQPHQQQQQSAGSAFAHHFNQAQAQAHQVHSLFDPSVFASASSYAPTSAHHHPHHSVLTLDPSIPGHHGLVLIPKSEDVCPPADFATRIGLNLGGRTYFSSEDDFMNRLYRRSRPADHGPINSPRCQAEGCHADLSQAKHYHRRHKVCEFHSKASTVIANGLTQRFCQQCSRFHLLAEFDNGKRSCRKRLADHNRRRRKTQQPNQENRSSQQRQEGTRNSSSDNVTKSPAESAGHSSSAVTVALSPPRMGLDCFRPRQYQNTTSSGSSSSLFFSSG
ncbi:putative transcription factor SBP family [Rosa chinensis]|uniref:Putative transcription factor SBP family n=1 Tax=Rosa chinensis TaxID=74649 RepID=A0A2P6SFL6_ROSCH|nr:squamosa promoter-binding-like protein 8 [Rosa chinensis]PRQ57460.1 putative transcription factor SBP family [Rosa chinensis]